LIASCAASIASIVGTKITKMNSSKCSNANSHARQFQHITSAKLKLREGSKRASQELSATASLLDISKKPGKTSKD
jgi:hypothetical protein